LGILKAIAGLIDGINSVVGHILAWAGLLLVLNVFIVVVLRYAFNTGEVWMTETYIWIHAFIFMLGAGYTLLHEGHVRIDLIYAGASARYKAVINILGTLFFAFPVLWLFYGRGADFFMRSLGVNESSPEVGGLPALYILKAAIPAMAILFALQFLSLALKSLMVLMGDKTALPREEGSAL